MLGLGDIPLLQVEASSKVTLCFTQMESLCCLFFCSTEVWTLSSRSHRMGHHQVFMTLFFHFKGKAWFGGKGQMAPGAESEGQLRGRACALMGSEKDITVKASRELAAIFGRSDMTPWNHRKSRFSLKGHMEGNV